MARPLSTALVVDASNATTAIETIVSGGAMVNDSNSIKQSIIELEADLKSALILEARTHRWQYNLYLTIPAWNFSQRGKVTSHRHDLTHRLLAG